MSKQGTLATTTSLCPTCLDRVPGEYVAQDEAVYLTRDCPDHGTASRKVWGSVDHWEWAGEFGPTVDGDPGEGDPVGTDGDLTVDNDHACLAVVEVTQDCNLSCSYCFASSGPGGKHRSFEGVVDLLETVKKTGGTRPVQFSGGEPTVREDLPALVERAREMGFEHVQVNTNGLKLATVEGYAGTLAEAGVTAVYLQFDGLRPETYEAIREVDIAAEKRAAVEACRAADLPVVLVPTIVPGVNGDEMGDIVRFAVEHNDVVESVNFQPVAHFGRHEEYDERFSLDEAAGLLAEQLAGVETRDLLPIPCCSSYCQMATAVLPREGGPAAVTGFLGEELFDSLSGMVDEGDWMELLATTPAGQVAACSAAGCCGGDAPDAVDADLGGLGGVAGGLLGGDEAGLLDDVVPVSLTGFMDADAGDVERLDECCISVPTPDGELGPFCGYNMTTDDGDYALRTRNGWGGRPAVDEPVTAELDVDLEATEPAGEYEPEGAGDLEAEEE